jgi:hypothetical protein
MMQSDIAMALTSGRMMTKYTGGRERPSCKEIAQLAYDFYETRGRRDGQDVDDWLAAERQLTHHYQSSRPNHTAGNGESNQHGKGHRS